MKCGWGDVVISIKINAWCLRRRCELLGVDEVWMGRRRLLHQDQRLVIVCQLGVDEV